MLDSRLPIVQAPMAGAQDSALAIAVASAGGVGSIPAGMLTPEALRDELRRALASTSGIINVNFFCHELPQPEPEREQRWRARLQRFYDELGLERPPAESRPSRVPFDVAAAEVLAACTPHVVSFHFGLPAPDLLARVKALGCRVLASANTVEEARWLEGRGVDGVIAQGAEAGGHRGMFLSKDVATQPGTSALVAELVRAVQVPVIAAGGIADARGVAAALALGAAAVQVGTAYLLADEATTSAVHRSALGTVASVGTAMTNVFTGRPARGIVNRLMRELGPMAEDVPPFPLASAALAPLRARAESRGSGDFSPLWCGENASGCRTAPAAEITRTLAGG